MDIYGAQKNIAKLLEYVQGLAADKPNMYEKSKDRLKEVADTCNQVVHLISQIIQDSSLSDDSQEFGSSSYLSGYLDNIEAEIAQLRQFVLQPNPSKNETVISKKELMKDYKQCLESLSCAALPCKAAEDCASLLWSWFHIRFYKANNPEFRYNMRYFSKWISTIVILYCYADAIGQLDEFIAHFNGWLEHVELNPTSVYAVPSFVHVFDPSVEPHKLTLGAVVMWDMLSDAGLKNVFGDSEFNLSSDCIYELCEKLCPEVLDDYVYYQNHQDVLNKLGWAR